MGDGAVTGRSSKRILDQIRASRRASYNGPDGESIMSAAVASVLEKGFGFAGSCSLLKELELPFEMTKSTFKREKNNYLVSRASYTLKRFMHGGKRHYVSKFTQEQKDRSKKAKVTRKLLVRKQRTVAVRNSEPTDTSDGYLSNVFKFPPFHVDATALFKDYQLDLNLLRDLAMLSFSHMNTYATPDSPDNSIINDKYDKSTGQRRRVFRDPRIARREFLGKSLFTKDDVLWVTNDSLDKDYKGPVLASAMIDNVSKVALKILMARLEALKIPVAEGFPKPLEKEFMKTQIGAFEQHEHGDSRHNIATMSLALSGDLRRKSTWYADDFEASFKRDRADRMRDYKFMQFDLTPGPCFTLSHAAHPHKGPGNRGATEDRYIMFFAFALDDDAYLFSTSEDVHRWVMSNTSMDEKNPDEVFNPKGL